MFFFNSIFLSADISNVKSIQHGWANEKLARQFIKKKQCKQNVRIFSFFDAGPCVQLTLPCLGVSPDAKVFDPAAANKIYFWLLEFNDLISIETVIL